MKLKTFWKRPVFWVSLPVLVALGGAAWFGIREALAAQEYRQKIAAMQASGRPISNADLDRQYTQRTSPERTQAWNETIYLLNTRSRKTESEQLPYVDVDPKTTTIDVDQAWEFEEPVRDLLEKYEPAIKKLHAVASQTGAPTWLPLEFDGMNTMLGNIASLSTPSQLLQLETEYAIRAADTERAARALSDIFATADSIDLTFAMSWHFQNHIRSIGYAMIRRSLSANQWTPEHLATLGQFTREPATLSQTWPSIIDNQIAAVIATLEGPRPDRAGPTQSFVQLSASLPSSRTAFLDAFEQLRNANTSDLLSWQNDIHRALDTLQSSPSIENFHWYRQLVQSSLQTENDRRLTWAAIAVKQYQLREGTWPRELDDATVENIRSVDHQSFGYEVDSGIAYLWKHRTQWPRETLETLPTPIPRNRPTDFSKPELSIQLMPLVTIR